MNTIFSKSGLQTYYGLQILTGSCESQSGLGQVPMALIFPYCFSGIALPCAIGVAINLYFLIHAIPAVRKKALPFRRYLLSINLAIGDVFMQSVTGGIAIVVIASPRLQADNLRTVRLLMAFFVLPTGFSFLIYFVYSVLNAFLLIAVKYPVVYKTRFTARHCHFINVFSWILGGLNGPKIYLQFHNSIANYPANFKKFFINMRQNGITFEKVSNF